MTIKNLDHLNLTVTDFNKTCDWYKRAFGFELVEEGKRDGVHWGIIKSGEAMLCIYEHPDFKQPDDPYSQHQHSINHFGLRIGNEADWEQTIEREKINVFYGGPVRYPHSSSWYVEDPNGYEIEVACWKDDQISFAA